VLCCWRSTGSSPRRSERLYSRRGVADAVSLDSKDYPRVSRIPAASGDSGAPGRGAAVRAACRGQVLCGCERPTTIAVCNDIEPPTLGLPDAAVPEVPMPSSLLSNVHVIRVGQLQ
jgi:hypothetical protein